MSHDYDWSKVNYEHYCGSTCAAKCQVIRIITDFSLASLAESFLISLQIVCFFRKPLKYLCFLWFLLLVPPLFICPFDFVVPCSCLALWWWLISCSPAVALDWEHCGSFLSLCLLEISQTGDQNRTNALSGLLCNSKKTLQTLSLTHYTWSAIESTII